MVAEIDNPVPDEIREDLRQTAAEFLPEWRDDEHPTEVVYEDADYHEYIVLSCPDDGNHKAIADDYDSVDDAPELVDMMHNLANQLCDRKWVEAQPLVCDHPYPTGSDGG